MNDASYYEAHVTVDLKRYNVQVAVEHLNGLCSSRGFKFASLTQTVQGRDKHSYILTGHDKQRSHLLERMVQMIKLLKLHGYPIERYKIEDITLDSRVEDSFGLLR